jgi:hypothetical protein
VKCSAMLSYDKKYRYQLTRSWSGEDGDGTHNEPLVWIMLNPSTADALKDDATIRRCIGFSLNMGFGGIEVYNLFAYRATNPAALLECKDPVGQENDKYLQAIPPGREIICAWGALPKGFGYQRLVLREKNVLMMLTGRKMRCFGYTQNGYPRHPVRLAYTTQLEEMLVPEPEHHPQQERSGQ